MVFWVGILFTGWYRNTDLWEGMKKQSILFWFWIWIWYWAELCCGTIRFAFHWSLYSRNQIIFSFSFFSVLSHQVAHFHTLEKESIAGVAHEGTSHPKCFANRFKMVVLPLQFDPVKTVNRSWKSISIWSNCCHSDTFSFLKNILILELRNNTFNKSNLFRSEIIKLINKYINLLFQRDCIHIYVCFFMFYDLFNN